MQFTDQEELELVKRLEEKTAQAFFNLGITRAADCRDFVRVYRAAGGEAAIGLLFDFRSIELNHMLDTTLARMFEKAAL